MARKQPIRIPAPSAQRPARRSTSYRSKVSDPLPVVVKYTASKKLHRWLKGSLLSWWHFKSSLPRPRFPKLRLPAPIIGAARPTGQTQKSALPQAAVATQSWPRRLAPAFAVSCVILSMASISAWQVNEQILKDLPLPSELSTRQQNLTTTILDRNGKVLYEVFEDENRFLIPLSEVPPHVIQATVAIEDKHFFAHRGVDLEGILRAVRSNSQGERVQGGSTITQQLVKLRLLSSEKTLRRKLREAVLAIQVERQYSKAQILEMYLNQVAYGGYTYGIEAASQRYFGKSAKNLTLAEATFLAALPAAPSVYNPFGDHSDLAYARQAEVLRRMVEEGYITQEAADGAKAETLAFVTEEVNIEAPHFVMYVKQLLTEQFGEALVRTGGLHVTTSLDLPLQLAAQQQVTDEVTKLNRLNISNGAALITNPQTGEVLSMVGSVNYFDTVKGGQVNVTQSQRQPGSSIKPLTYALALERGYTPATLLDDTPVRFLIEGGEPYVPQNYDGSFHGQVSLRQSLASSYNIPAVRLLNTIGINTMINKAQEIGFTTWEDRKRFGLALTLGGGEVQMDQMALLYGSFANQGQAVALNPILEVSNQQGEVLYHNHCALNNSECDGKKIFDPRIAYQITSILSDNEARSPAFGYNSVLNIPNQEVAVKTGTTNSLRDNWTIGYTSDRVVAVWVGNNDNTPMSSVTSGITGASPIWNRIIRLTLADDTPHHFAQPPGLVQVAMCGKTVAGSCTACSNPKAEYFLPGTEPHGGCYASRLPLDLTQPSSAPRSEDNTGPASRPRWSNTRVPNGPTASTPAPSPAIRDQVLEGMLFENVETNNRTEEFLF